MLIGWLVQIHFGINSLSPGIRIFPSWVREGTFLMGNVCPTFRMNGGGHGALPASAISKCLQLKVISLLKWYNLRRHLLIPIKMQLLSIFLLENFLHHANIVNFMAINLSIIYLIIRLTPTILYIVTIYWI